MREIRREITRKNAEARVIPSPFSYHFGVADWKAKQAECGVWVPGEHVGDVSGAFRVNSTGRGLQDH